MGRDDLASQGQFVELSPGRIECVKTAEGRMQRETAEVRQAGLAQIDLGDHCVCKTLLRIRLNANDPTPLGIQDEQMSAGLINRHPLRIFNAEAPRIESVDRLWIEAAIGLRPDLDQLVCRGLEDQQPVGADVEGHVDRSRYTGSNLDSAGRVSGQ